MVRHGMSCVALPRKLNARIGLYEDELAAAKSRCGFRLGALVVLMSALVGFRSALAGIDAVAYDSAREVTEADAGGDFGFADRANHDYTLKPGAYVLRHMPGFRPYQFDRMRRN